MEERERHQPTADLLAGEFGAGWREHFRPVFAEHPPALIDGGQGEVGGTVSVVLGAHPELCGALLTVHREHAMAEAHLWWTVANAVAADRDGLVGFLSRFRVAELHACSGAGDNADPRWRARCALEGTSALVENLDPPKVILPSETDPLPPEIRSGHALLERRWAGARSVPRPPPADGSPRCRHPR